MRFHSPSLCLIVPDMWKLPILQHFDYVLSIDADAAIQTTNIDLFEQAHRSGAYFGYHQCHNDWRCTVGLWDLIEKYMRTKNIQPLHWKQLPRDSAYYGFFVMFNARFWRSHQGVSDLMDCILPNSVSSCSLILRRLDDASLPFADIDQSGNIFYKRWAEQVFFPIALALFAPYSKVYHMGGDFQVLHYRGLQVAQPQCPGAQVQPQCCSS